MKKQVTRLLIIIMLAVLFVPLFSNQAKAEIYIYDNPVLRGFADWLYSASHRRENNIYHITIPDTDGRYIVHPNIETVSLYHNTQGDVYFLEINGSTYGGFSTKLDELRTGASSGIILPEGYQPALTTVLTYQDYVNDNYEQQVPEINTRPVLDLPFYIMYSSPDYNFINLQSYENLPVFTFGDYSNIDKMEFDVNWYGYGKMKRYILQDGEWFLSETKLEGQTWNDTGLDRKIIMECNHSILDFTGETSLEPINFSSGQPPKIMGGSFDQQGYGVKFILPRNGFKDNSFIWSYQTWFRLPYDDIEGDKYIKDTVELGFGGDYKEGTKQVDFSNMQVKTIDGRKIIEGNYTVSVGHDVGINEVTFQAKRNNDDKYWSATLQTERLAGFVDEDGDGLDDRTGREDNNEENPWHYDDYNPDGNRPDRGQYGDDIIGTVSYYFDTLLYWLLSPFRLIAEGLQSTLTIVTDTFGWAGNFANMIGGLFSFLPPEITGMITLAFTSLIVFTIIKVVRK